MKNDVKNNYFVKIVLIVCTIAVLVFQSCSLAINSTSAETKERVKQAQLLATLNLSTNDAGEYLVQSASDFTKLGNFCVNGGDTLSLIFRQTNDIDFSGYSTGTNPVGTSKYKFKGTYYGDKYKMSNFKVYPSWSSDAGLFGYVDGGKIYNVVVDNADVWGRNGFSAGVIAGSIYNRAVIQNCMVLNSNVRCWADTDSTLGGIVGYINSSSAIIRYCFSNAYVHATGYGTTVCGGIAGYCNGASFIDRCEARGTVTSGDGNTAEAHAGGIVGVAKSARIEDCNVYSCTIDATAKKTTDSSSSPATSTDSDGYLSVTKTTNISSVIYNAYAGGIAGYATNSDITETYVHSTTIDGGYKADTYSYEYKTNNFAAIRGSRAVYPVYWAYDYTYYNFSFTLYEQPKVVKKYANYTVGNSDTGNTYENNYRTSVSYTTGAPSGNALNTSISALTGKKRTESKNYSRPGDTTSTACDTSLSISQLAGSYAVGWQNSSSEIYKIWMPLFYYCTNGTSTFTFQGQTASNTTTAFEMLLTWTYETPDKSALADLGDGDGMKLSLTWDFTYGWGNGNETYTYTDTPLDGSDYSSSAGKTATTYSSSSSNLSSSYWSTSSSIHGGYPHLRYFYWSDGATTPS